MKTYLNASEVAKLLNVNRATVTRWIHSGEVAGAVRLSGKQQWRIPFSSYEALIRHHRQHQRPRHPDHRDVHERQNRQDVT